MIYIVNLLLPLAVELIKAYIKNSSTEKDDLVLDITKQGCHYLAKNDNNTVTFGHYASIENTQMKG